MTGTSARIDGKAMWKKLLLWGVLAPLGLLLGLVSAFVLYLYVDQPQRFEAPRFDSVAPELPADLGPRAVLIFSKTNGYRHEEGIPAAQRTLTAIAERNGWPVYLSENGAAHNADALARFAVVVWANVSGPALTAEQQNALRAFVESGGGFVGIHASGDGSHKDWDWYHGTVVRANHTGHTLWPHMQDGDMHTVAGDHPVMAGLPRVWRHHDEWYSFGRSPRERGSQVLAVVDEGSYDPGMFTMPDEHALIWTHPVGEGRVVYSALGHAARSFDTPEYQRLLEQAMRWTGRL